MPSAIEWFANIDNPQTRRAYENDLRGFMQFVGIYRVVYTARLTEVVNVLHAFQKKTQATWRRDIELAKSRYTELMRGTK